MTASSTHLSASTPCRCASQQLTFIRKTKTKASAAKYVCTLRHVRAQRPRPLQAEQCGRARNIGSPPVLCPPSFILFFAGRVLGTLVRGGSLRSLPLHGSDSSGSLRSLFIAIVVLVFHSDLSSLAFHWRLLMPPLLTQEKLIHRVHGDGWHCRIISCNPILARAVGRQGVRNSVTAGDSSVLPAYARASSIGQID